MRLSNITIESQAYFPADGEYFAYFDDTSAASCSKALEYLETYIIAEGPFDGVLAFSQGASLASTLMIHNFKQTASSNSFNQYSNVLSLFLGSLQSTLPRYRVVKYDCSTVKPMERSFRYPRRTYGAQGT